MGLAKDEGYVLAEIGPASSGRAGARLAALPSPHRRAVRWQWEAFGVRLVAAGWTPPQPASAGAGAVRSASRWTGPTATGWARRGPASSPKSCPSRRMP
ncbi:hypothetical protein GCM10010361_14460 [Streptomyces olivaceiscleroticus]|uniref:Uncharacterized protein n=1 Tax=Streptomyces olivaceiscleroticus TaxID=68245 RepID=A0ABN0ZL08_9ACTN